jgi:hypothetical protein
MLTFQTLLNTNNVLLCSNALCNVALSKCIQSTSLISLLSQSIAPTCIFFEWDIPYVLFNLPLYKQTKPNKYENFLIHICNCASWFKSAKPTKFLSKPLFYNYKCTKDIKDRKRTRKTHLKRPDIMKG